MAKRYPARNFIGIDLKGNRLYVGAKKCIAQNISNAAFLRIQIDKITSFFGKDEVSEIWITFPDPQLRTSKAKKRLTHPKFLRLYQQVLTSNGLIHLKTDSPHLYEFTKKVIDLYKLDLISDIDNLYQSADFHDDLAIKTHYEGLDIAQSHRIHYLQFRLPLEPLPNIDKALQEQLKLYEGPAEGRD